MPLKKGRQKTGGRKVGSVNHTTKEIRELINQTLDVSVIKRRMNAIEDDFKYCQVAIKMMEFVVPKLKSVEMTGNSEKPIIVQLPENMNTKQLRELLESTEDDSEQDEQE